jgi:hypothetical protein
VQIIHLNAGKRRTV